MKKFILAACILLAFFSCNKSTDTRPTSSFGQGVAGLGFNYNKAHIFYFVRSGIRDSDFVIFHPNGSVTEVSNRFDSGSYLYPDSLTYVVNTSYDNNITWENLTGIDLFAFYPIYDSLRTGKHFLLHDYLVNEVVNLYRNNGNQSPNIQVTPTLADSTASVTGWAK